jgi:hypothetical protein
MKLIWKDATMVGKHGVIQFLIHGSSERRVEQSASLHWTIAKILDMTQKKL